MSDGIILKVENVSKQYRLGTIGTGTISHDLNRWWSRIRGKEDPYLKIGETNDRSSKGDSEYVWALKDVNFEVKKGEVLGIIGKNGAGKSTLLKILSQVTGPTTGRIKSKGRIASLLEVGTGFHPEMTGKENIYLNGAILGMSKKEINSKLNEIIDFSGCERYIDTPVKRYSSGMKVRLAFAVAAFLEPDILVVDEVLAVGDAEFQKKAIGKMQDISNTDGRTVLFVSHNMVAVKSLCTKAVIVRHGEISFEGEVELAVNMYLNDVSLTSQVDLSERKDRKGNGKLKFTKIQLNRGGKVLPNRPLEIRLKYITDEELENLSLAVTICSGYDERIVTIDNIHQGEKIDILNKEGELIIGVPNLYLNSGDYTINVWCSYKNELLDYIINAKSFFVEKIDVYETGKALIKERHGPLLIDKCFWEVSILK